MQKWLYAVIFYLDSKRKKKEQWYYYGEETDFF